MVAPEGWSCTTYTDVDLGSYANVATQMAIGLNKMSSINHTYPQQ